MLLSFDRTGFPLVRPESCAAAMHLLPVAKVQLEGFLADRNDFGDRWYSEVLAQNPRVSWRRFGDPDRERVFVGGVLPGEASEFAAWLGPGFALPTVEQWRATFRALERIPFTKDSRRNLIAQCPSEPAREVLEQIVRHAAPKTWLDLSLMRGGLVEWAAQEGRPVGIGVPRPEFYPTLWNPLVDAVPVQDTNSRLFFFGMRIAQVG